MRRRDRAGRRMILVGSLAIGLSGCATDPAFLEGLALATSAIAADTAQMAEEARCVRHVSLNGETTTFCPLPPGVVAMPPRVGPSPYDRDRPHGRESRDWREPSRPYGR